MGLLSKKSLLVAFFALSITTGASVVITGNNGVSMLATKGAKIEDYKIVFNKDTGRLLTATAKTPSNNLIANVKDSAGSYHKIEFETACFKRDSADIFGTFDFAYFGGAYIRNLTPINGIKSIKINHVNEDKDTDFVLLWGWDEVIRDYEDFTNSIFACYQEFEYDDETYSDNFEFDFYNDLPNYFALINWGGEEQIKSLEIEYCCHDKGTMPDSYKGFEDIRFSKNEEDYYSETTLEGLQVSESSDNFNNSNLNIPDTFWGQKVTAIGDMAFRNKSSLKSVTFGKNVQKIGFNSFASTGLSKVIIPSNIKDIGDSAFEGCKDLTKVYFEKNDDIGLSLSAFKSCASKGVFDFYLEGTSSDVLNSYIRNAINYCDLKNKKVIMHYGVSRAEFEAL